MSRWTTDELKPAMTHAEATGIAEELLPDGAVLTVGAFLAEDVPAIDPRIHLVGDHVVWVARGASGVGADGTSSAEIVVFDDSSGHEIARLALRADDRRPVRLRIEAVGQSGRLNPFFAIDRADGTPLVQGPIADTYLGAQLPALLDPGAYRIRAWLAELDVEGPGSPVGECAVDVTVDHGDEVELDVRYESGNSCTLTIEEPGTSPSGPSPSPTASPTASPSPMPDPIDRLLFTCGDDRTFSASLFDEAGDAELDDHPAAAALRDLLGSSTPVSDRLPDSGWYLTGMDDTSATFVARVEEEPGFVRVTSELQGQGWQARYVGWCTPRVDLDSVSLAIWSFAPGKRVPGPEATSFEADVTELACTGSTPMGDRLLPPTILYGKTQVLVIFAARPLPAGAYTCPGNPSTRVAVELSEPIGDRMVVDGSSYPPRNPSRGWP